MVKAASALGCRVMMGFLEVCICFLQTCPGITLSAQAGPGEGPNSGTENDLMWDPFLLFLNLWS